MKARCPIASAEEFQLLLGVPNGLGGRNLHDERRSVETNRLAFLDTSVGRADLAVLDTPWLAEVVAGPATLHADDDVAIGLVLYSPRASVRPHGRERLPCRSGSQFAGRQFRKFLEICN
jgi:hypothetical protein